ncbi:MAG: cytidylate kinase family protein [Candidatus Parvarchaeota archaeon]|nr:cytidylate kinase family protein [Candidatus Rehaiarchaeum fermentans]
MRVLIAGLTGSGKSSVSKTVAEYLGLNYVSGSSLLKTYIKKSFYTWESKEGLEILKERLKDLSIDKSTDNKLIAEIKKSADIVVDSWTMPWLWKEDAIRVYLKAREDIRIERIVRRDKINPKDAKYFINQKDTISQNIYKKLYKIDYSDLSIFDLVLDTSYLSIESVSQIIAKYILNYSKV